MMKEKRATSLCSSEATGSNEDLLREIFLYLPVRSLIRFKLVSKHWSSVISDAQFVCDRTRRLNPNSVVPSGIFFYNSLTGRNEIESVSFDDSSVQRSRVRVPSLLFLNTAAALGSKIMILQSCNGLLLCKFTSKLGNEYCVCNPTTKKFKMLPRIILNPREVPSGFTLAFDPSVSLHYKVVYLIKKYDNSRPQIVIYSSESGQWNTSAYCSDKICHGPLPSFGFFWNSSIHWVNKHYFRSWYCRYEYNFEKENFNEFEMPPNPPGYYERNLWYIGESKGRLHLIYVRSRSAKRFHILEMDRETLKWSVKYRVQICHLLSKFPEIGVEVKRVMNGIVEYVYSILCVYKGEKEEDSALVLSIPGKVVSYNLHYKTAKVLSELPSDQVVDTYSPHFRTAFNFIESLASV